jgi:lecithin-cholesterol acyltransferase
MGGFGRGKRSRFAAAAMILGLLCAALPASTLARKPAAEGLTPIVLFPAFHFTRLQVDVHGQTVDAACPTNGSFEDWFLVDVPSTFSQVCQDELLTLRYDNNPHKPMPLRFSNQHGVRVSIADYGSTKSAPFYEPMYTALEGAGYTRDKNIRVAGYDSRLAPDAQGWLQQTKQLIEQTSRANGNRPVHLVGHSNGPIYAQYVLTHTSAAWKHRYIHGFTPIAGNFPGQGGVYPLFFTGLNVSTFTFPETTANAVSSARLYLSTPSTYLSSADPVVFGDKETVIADASTGKSYTPEDYGALFDDAGVPWAHDIADYYIGGVPFVDPAHFPDVDVYAEKGSGIETLVGIGLPNLTIGQLLGSDAVFFTRDGDINQEDLTNDAVGAWAAMSCWLFSLTDNPGVNHFELPGNAGLLARLIANANAPRSNC